MSFVNDYIAELANTASKQPRRYPHNYPKRILKGRGYEVKDEVGNKYIDFVNGLGAISLGYRFKEVDDFVCQAIKDYGTIFSLPHQLENVLGKMLCDIIPCAEMVRLLHNGKDATEAAVRLARHITGHEKILSFSYHGAVDTFMASTPADKGVPLFNKSLIQDFDYNDFGTVKKAFEENDIACVILEPHTIRKPEDGFLEFLREITIQNGSLLIFDEVVTFPRYPKLSAQATYGVTPDLTCISKGMANGYAISALVGRQKFMKHLADGEVFVSTTQGGNLVGVSAAIKTLEIYDVEDVPMHLQDIGIGFREGIEKNDLLHPTGIACRQFFNYKDNETRDKFLQEMIKEGVFFGVPIFFTYTMTSDLIKKVCKKINEVVKRLPEVKLEGEGVKEVFIKR